MSAGCGRPRVAGAVQTGPLIPLQPLSRPSSLMYPAWVRACTPPRFPRRALRPGLPSDHTPAGRSTPHPGSPPPGGSGWNWAWHWPGDPHPGRGGKAALRRLRSEAVCSESAPGGHGGGRVGTDEPYTASTGIACRGGRGRKPGTWGQRGYGREFGWSCCASLWEGRTALRGGWRRVAWSAPSAAPATVRASAHDLAMPRPGR